MNINILKLKEILEFYSDKLNYHDSLQDNEQAKVLFDNGDKAIEGLKVINELLNFNSPTTKEVVLNILDEVEKIKITFGNPSDGIFALQKKLEELKEKYK